MLQGREFTVFAWMMHRLVSGITWARPKPYYARIIFENLSRIGSDSLAIISVIAACTGIILALQSAQQLERVGALSYVAILVGVTIIKELGPLLTAIIVTGRSGAAFTAEIATMQISEEIDALEVMGLEPVSMLVWPKLLGMLVMVPVLTVWANFVGLLAGGLFSVSVLGISANIYFENTVTFLKLADFYSGLLKSVAFAITITLIGCWQGFLARDGASDVGRRTTRAVVQSIFLIILFDLFFTTLNYVVR